MKYVEQSARDLVFYFEEGESVQDLTILKEQTLTLPDVKIRAAIIGESHFVIFRAFNVTATEIIACVERNLNPSTCYSTRLCNTFSPFCHEFSHAHYHLQITVYDDWKKGMNALHGIRILAEKPAENGIGLIQKFPKEANDREPCTFLAVTAKENLIRVNSIHTYPTDNHGRGRIVQTMSCLEKL